jgi:hypothetical protein
LAAPPRLVVERFVLAAERLALVPVRLLPALGRLALDLAVPLARLALDLALVLARLAFDLAVPLVRLALDFAFVPARFAVLRLAPARVISASARFATAFAAF